MPTSGTKINRGWGVKENNFKKNLGKRLGVGRDSAADEEAQSLSTTGLRAVSREQASNQASRPSRFAAAETVAVAGRSRLVE